MSIKSKNKYGKQDLLSEDLFNSKNVKVRITTFIDEDILNNLKIYASKQGLKYQTALNMLLRNFFENPGKTVKVKELNEARVRKIVREELKKRA